MRKPTLRPLQAALLLAFSTSAGAAAPIDALEPAPDGVGVPQQPDGASPMLQAVEVTGSAVSNDYKTSTSTIGARMPTPLRDIPQTVNVIDRALLDAQGVSSLSDALRNVPGITIGGAEGGQIGNNINLRGFSARTDVYLDGMRDRGQFYRDTFNLDAIEVLKGPSSMLFGRGSTGGVINQVSKVPMLTELGEIFATTGTDDRYRISTDFNRPFSDTAAGRLNLFAQDIHSTRDVMYNKDAGIAPSLRFGIGEPTQITLSALLQHNRDMPDYGLPPVNGKPADVDHAKFYGLTDDRTIQDVAVIAGRIEHVFNGNLTFKDQLQYNWYRTDALETAPNNLVTVDGVPLDRTTGNYTDAPLDDILVQLASHDRIIHDTSLGNQADLIAIFNTGSWQNTLLSGVELARDT
jgi:catecholate siderophore receptor